MEDSDGLKWRKSSFSGGNGAECVEVASDGRAVLVRDTKRREAGHLAVDADGWRVFIAAVKVSESGRLP